VHSHPSRHIPHSGTARTPAPLTAGQAPAPAGTLGRPDIVEHYRFAEENPAVSRVFFRKKANFRVLARSWRSRPVLAVLAGLAGLMVRQWRMCAARDATEPRARIDQ